MAQQALGRDGIAGEFGHRGRHPTPSGVERLPLVAKCLLHWPSQCGWRDRIPIGVLEKEPIGRIPAMLFPRLYQLTGLLDERDLLRRFFCFGRADVSAPN